MTVQTLRVGRERLVVLRERDYKALLRQAEGHGGRRRPSRPSAEDRADVAEAVRRLNDPKEKRIPWSQVKKSAGLP